MYLQLLPHTLRFLLCGLGYFAKTNHTVRFPCVVKHPPALCIEAVSGWWWQKLLDGYLKKGHVGAIVAVAFVIVCVVDEGTVFLWDAITWGNTTQLFLYNKCSIGLTCRVTKAKYGWWLVKKYTWVLSLFYTTEDEEMAINVCIRDVTITVFAPNQHSLMLNIQPITIQYCFIIFSMYYCPIIVEQCTFSLKDTK